MAEFPIVSPMECAIVYEVSKKLKAKKVLELGIGKGMFTRSLLLAAKENDGMVTSVDNLDLEGAVDSELYNFVRQLGLEKYWKCIIMDDIEFAKEWKGFVDLLVIDTSHEYEHTRKELELYVPFVKETGQILLHDVLHPKHYRDLNLAVFEFLINERKKEVDKPMKLCWNYNVYNTYCGIGKLYRSLNEGKTNHKSVFGENIK